MKQLHWDHETAKLRERLVSLSDSIWPEFLVTGAIAVIRERLAVAMDLPGATAKEQERISFASDLKTKALEERTPRMTDAHLDEYLARANARLAIAPRKATDATATARKLEQLAAELFTPEFWSAYNVARLRPPQSDKP